MEPPFATPLRTLYTFDSQIYFPRLGFDFYRDDDVCSPRSGPRRDSVLVLQGRSRPPSPFYSTDLRTPCNILRIYNVRRTHLFFSCSPRPCHPVGVGGCCCCTSSADVADTADLKVIDRNYGRRPMSDEDQRYTARLMAKHGLDQHVSCRAGLRSVCVRVLGGVRGWLFG